MVTSSAARELSGQDTGQILEPPHRSRLGLRQCGDWESLCKHRCPLKGHFHCISGDKHLQFSHLSELLTQNLMPLTSPRATQYFLVEIDILH